MTEKTFQKRDWLFIFGTLFVTLCSHIAGVFDLGIFYLFSIFVFGLGWNWRVGSKRKVLSILLLVPFAGMFFLLVMEMTRFVPETFLVPEGYRGAITVIYGEPCGEEPVYENGSRVYRFTESGILIVRNKRITGRLDHKFYFVGETGNLTKIPKFSKQSFENEQNPPLDSTKETVGAFWNYGARPIPFAEFFSYLITNYRYFEKDDKQHWQEHGQYATKAEELLKKCRQSIQRQRK